MVQPAKRDLDLQSPSPKSSTGSGKRPPRTTVARLGEAAAARFLEQRGCTLICSNWRSGRFAEIDLIMQSPDGLILFVEVKTRWRSGESAPEQDAWLSTINRRKRHKIIIAAQSYLIQSRQSWTPARIDAIAVSYRDARKLDGQWELVDLDFLHVPGAFHSV